MSNIADDDKHIIALLAREITKQDFIREFCRSQARDSAIST